VRDLRSTNVIYKEVLTLADSMSAPGATITPERTYLAEMAGSPDAAQEEENDGSP
jgi:hypothetical protein